MNTKKQNNKNYADVNGLQMYYEIHGEGKPLILLHGAFSNIDSDFGRVIPELVKKWKLICIEQQAHGHTGDIDRPLNYEQMADDTVALLKKLNITQADFFGYSMGGNIALMIAKRHPKIVHKCIWVGGASYHLDGLYPEISGMANMTAAALIQSMHGSPWQQAYEKIAPNPNDWPNLIAKKLILDQSFTGWQPAELQEIEIPVMLMIGDADIVRPEHTAAMFRLLGGGVPGDFYGIPRAQFAVLPGTTHVTIMNRSEWLTSMVNEFLDAPIPGKQK